MTSIIKVDTLQDTGGNTILSSNGTGTFTSNLPSVANTPIIVAKATSTTSIPTGTNTKITLDNEIIDTNAVFSNSRFTVTSAGKYQITGILSVNLTSATASLNALIFKNGSEASWGIGKSNEASANTVSAVTSIILDLAVNDYVELYGSHNNGSTLNSNTSNYTSLEIYKLIGA